MKKAFKIAIVTLLSLGVLALTVLYINTHTIDVLEPKGMIGQEEAELINTSSLLMLIVVIPVFILTWAFAWKYRANRKARHEPDWEHNYIAEYCWWGVPVVIIIILAVMTYKSTHKLNPFTPIVNGKKPISIQVVALNWKWLFLYPEYGIATVNFIQFPTQIPIDFSITSDAPMNSFWIPQLGGQIYAMPAMRSQLHLIANETGNFNGVSSNISGKGFAGMKFIAHASTQQEFDEWLLKVKQTSNHLNLATYEQLMAPTEYHPVEYYILDQPDLFDAILMKYMCPEHKEK